MVAASGDLSMEGVRVGILSWYKDTYAHARSVMPHARPSRRVAQAVLDTTSHNTTGVGSLEQKEKDIVHGVYLKYAEGSKGVNREHLKTMMTDLNEGKAPTDEEVSFVISVCDVDGGKDGQGLSQDEFARAVTLWYLELEEAAIAVPPLL